MDCLKIISLNTRGTANKFDRIIKEIEEYDIILLQEQIINDKTIQNFQNKLKCTALVSTDNENGRSIITLIKDKQVKYLRQKEILIQGRLSKITLKLEGTKLTILNIYGPAQIKDRNNFWNRAIEMIKKEQNIILGGDFNIVLNKDDTDGKFKEEMYVKKIKDFMKLSNLTDIHTILWSNGLKYTYTSSRKTRIRLDRFLISNNIQNKIVDYKVIINSLSDHEGISVKISTGKRNIWGKGIWKLNCEFLNEKYYVGIITEIIENEIDRKFEKDIPDCGAWWDSLKVKIKKASISYAIDRKNV